MAWSTEEQTGNVTVVVRVNGETREYEYEGTKKLKDAVYDAANKSSLKDFLVKANGNDVQKEQGDKPLSEFGNVELIPKFSGA